MSVYSVHSATQQYTESFRIRIRFAASISKLLSEEQREALENVHEGSSFTVLPTIVDNN